MSPRGGRRARAALVALAALVAGVALAACGVTTKNADRSPQIGPNGKRVPRTPKLPARPAGVVAIDGERQGSLTPVAVQEFGNSQNAVNVQFNATGENQAFADLCQGKVDIVDSVRQISAAELAACSRRGIQLAPQVQVGSDAVVVATRNESDVGGDCITVTDVNSIFRSGSTIDNWSQLGFDDLPLHAAGPNQRSNVFAFFTQKVFGLPASASLSDFRGDYRAQATDDGVREQVVNSRGVRRAQDLAAARLAAATAADNAARVAFINQAVLRADRRVRREIDATNKRNARLKISVNGAKLARDNARKSAQAKSAAATQASRQFDARATRRVQQLNAAAINRASTPGVVGYFRFTYYENYEDQLRPLEIDGTPRAASTASSGATTTPGQTTSTVTAASPSVPSPPARPNCIFPSQETITSTQYPLSRSLLLYVPLAYVKRPEVQRFLTYFLANAQRLATANRLVPITDQLRDNQLQSLTGRKPSASASAGGASPASTPSGASGASAAPGTGGVPGVAAPRQGG